MKVLHDSDEIEITYQRGKGSKAIISFSGIGLQMGGIQIAEFRKSLAGVTNHVYFVKDKARHWYNSTFDTIADLLNEDFARKRIDHVQTLGNSMGGFGALAFAGRLQGCGSAISFSPQSAVDPSIVPWEKRYVKFTDTVTEWHGLDATKLLVPSVNYTVIFGDKGIVDLRHAQRIADAAEGNLSLYLISDAAHAVAAFLKRKRVLRMLIQLLVVTEGRGIDARTVLHDLDYRAPLLAPGFQ